MAGTRLAPNFVCTANIEAADGGAAIVAGNQRVLSARLADAKFFWEQDLKVPLEEQATKLSQIVFHEKLGTVADKVERVAKLARWLVDEGIVKPPPGESAEELACLAETAARLCKADLVTGLVGEFPELQGIIGGHLALCQGHARAISDAIRDHYRPAGQGDHVPNEPVTVAVGLADRLDTLATFFVEEMLPTGSKDPFALRRTAIGAIALIIENRLRVSLRFPLSNALAVYLGRRHGREDREAFDQAMSSFRRLPEVFSSLDVEGLRNQAVSAASARGPSLYDNQVFPTLGMLGDFFADRLKVQQREAGVRHDLIDAAFSLSGKDDLVRLLARVKALQAFVETSEGADLLAGYKRAANILKKEGWGAGHPVLSGSDEQGIPQTGEEDPLVLVEEPAIAEAVAALAHPEHSRNKPLSYTPEKEEEALIAALDSAEPKARAAVEAEDFEGAMAALASLRAPVDAFFDKVIVNDPDENKREARLNLLARMREAVHQVADFSRIEG